MVKILIINNAEKGIKEFVTLLYDIAAEAEIKPIIIEYEQSLDMDLSFFDGVILSGSPRGNDIVTHHLPYFQWILSYQKPIFGICAGHHIVGKLYGAKLLRSKEKEVGENLLFIQREDPIFSGCSSSFPVRQNHHDSITLPENFILLGSSEGCNVAMMRHPDKSLYTTQFHPEFLNKNLLLNFFSIVEKNKRSLHE